MFVGTWWSLMPPIVAIALALLTKEHCLRGVPLAHCWRQNSTRGLRLIRCLTQ